MIPFIQVLIQKRITTLNTLDLSCRFEREVLELDNQLDDHFAQSLLDVFVSANVDCSIRSIVFDGESSLGSLLLGNPFSPSVLQQMKCIYGGK